MRVNQKTEVDQKTSKSSGNLEQRARSFWSKSEFPTAPVEAYGLQKWYNLSSPLASDAQFAAQSTHIKFYTH